MNAKKWIGRLLPILLNLTAAVLELSGISVTWYPTLALTIVTVGQLILGNFWVPVKP